MISTAGCGKMSLPHVLSSTNPDASITHSDASFLHQKESRHTELAAKRRAEKAPRAQRRLRTTDNLVVELLGLVLDADARHVVHSRVGDRPLIAIGAGVRGLGLRTKAEEQSEPVSKE